MMNYRIITRLHYFHCDEKVIGGIKNDIFVAACVSDLKCSNVWEHSPSASTTTYT